MQFLVDALARDGYDAHSNYLRGIAQSGSAPALGAGCRGFESLYPDHVIMNHPVPVAQSDRASAF
jgi:hypothetical protein